MASFDFSNWQKNKIALIVILVIIVGLIWMASKGIAREGRGKGIPGRHVADGNGTAYYQGRGCKDDSVSILLDRIDWATYAEKKTTLWYKQFITAVIVAGLIAILIMRKIPSPSQSIMLIVIIFIPIYAVHQLRYVHGDIHNDYNIKNNVDLLRQKLNLKKGKNVPPPSCSVPKRTAVMNPK